MKLGVKFGRYFEFFSQRDVDQSIARLGGKTIFTCQNVAVEEAVVSKQWEEAMVGSGEAGSLFRRGRDEEACLVEETMA